MDHADNIDIRGEVSRTYEFAPQAIGIMTTVIVINGGELFCELDNGAHMIRAGRMVHIIPRGWKHLAILFPEEPSVAAITEDSRRNLSKEAHA